MKETLSIITGILVGIIVFVVVSALEERVLFIPLFILEIAKWGLSIVSGIITYRFFSRGKKVSISSPTPEEKKIKVYGIILYVLLSLQAIWSVGYANEFEDHIFIFAIAVIFFALQLYFLFQIRTKGIMVLLSIITFLHLFVTIGFVSDGANIISNKWPEELYYATRHWVILMLLGTFSLDGVKFGVLYRDSIKRFLSR